MAASERFEYDLFVVGGGSGGVRAARVSAAHGAKVALAEGFRVGGTCVIRGCVPKKLLVYAAHFAEDLQDACRFGWEVDTPTFNWPRLRDDVQAEVTRLEGLYTQTLGNHNVEIWKQQAKIVGAHEVELADGTRVTAKNILICTGAWPLIPDIPGKEHGITSNEVFHLESLPRRVLVVGAGYIANEFAGIFHQYGAKVTLLNRSHTILRSYDHQITDRLLKISTAKGIEFKLGSDLERIVKNDDGSLMVHASNTDPICADLVLFATGRRARTEDLGLDSVGIELGERGEIPVDAEARTRCPSIYAVGDVTDRVQLTPVAIREGQAFADRVFGNKPTTLDYSCIPSAVFSHPPIAAVGLTEAQAREKYGAVKVYTSDFRPMKNALAGRDERSLYKMVCEPDSERVLGLHMIGPDAPEILQAAAVAVRAGLSKKHFDDTVALHPTMSEELVLLR